MGRPRCITHNIASIDGRLTLAPEVNLMAGDPRWAAAAADDGDPYAWIREFHDPQVLLEGRGSFLVDETPSGTPGKRNRLSTSCHRTSWACRAAAGSPSSMVGAEWTYSSPNGPTPPGPGGMLWSSPARQHPAEHLRGLRERGIPYLVTGRTRVDLPDALELLAGMLQVRTVVCTGGGRLGGAPLRAGLIDEVDIEVLPVAIGGRGTPALFDAPPLQPDQWPVPLELLTVEHLTGGRLRLRYAVQRAQREHRVPPAAPGWPAPRGRCVSAACSGSSGSGAAKPESTGSIGD